MTARQIASHLACRVHGLTCEIENPDADQLADALAVAVAEMQDAGLLDDNCADLVAQAQTMLGI